LGTITALDVWKAADEAISRREPVVRAFLYYDREGSRRQAQDPRPGVLSGMPLVVKDLADVRYMPTTGGSRAYQRMPLTDARVVHRWREQGAVVLGKTNTEELAFGVVTAPTTNPWSPQHIPGGSSGGTAAAVAAGMAMGGLGTDTAGSIRIPAALCGVVGFKPSFGQIPLDGVMALAPSLDTAGPLAGTVEDAALLYEVMRGEGHGDASPAPAPPSAVLVPTDYLRDRMNESVARLFAQAVAVFSAGGVRVDQVALAPWPVWRDVFLAVRRPESYVVHQAVLASDRRALLGGNLAARLEEGASVSAPTYLVAQQERMRMARQYAAHLADGQVLVLPTVGVPAPKVGDAQVYFRKGPVSLWEALVGLTLPASVLGFPALSIPMGMTAEGLPAGLQLVGAPGADREVLAVGGWWAQQAPCHPPLPV